MRSPSMSAFLTARFLRAANAQAGLDDTKSRSERAPAWAPWCCAYVLDDIAATIYLQEVRVRCIEHAHPACEGAARGPGSP